MEITNSTLYEKQYSEQELIDNIDSLYQYIIVRTQKNLSKNFINSYILNSKYNSCSKDEDITLETLYSYQPDYFKPNTG